MHDGTHSHRERLHDDDMQNGHTVRVGISANARLMETFDEIIRGKGYANRSEAIRDLMRDQLVEAAWAEDNEDVVGTVTIVYNHDSKELTQKLTDLQHHSHNNIISSLHVHLDEHNCLEVLVIRGKGRIVKDLSDKLIGTKGVKHGKLAMSSTGQGLY